MFTIDDKVYGFNSREEAEQYGKDNFANYRFGFDKYYGYYAYEITA